MSSRRSRTSARAPRLRRRRRARRTCGGSPRTTATGSPSALPLTRSPAAASSSAMATTVALSGLPYASVPPRRSSSTRTPAAPMATSVSPLRQGRPKVSVTTHADVDAQRVPQPVADPPRGGVGVLGQQQHGARGGVGGVDPGRGHHEALPVLDDPQRARAARPPARSRRRWPPRGRRPATIRPSALLTIFEVTTRTSPSTQPGLRGAAASTISFARSSPGRTSGMPGKRPHLVRGHRSRRSRPRRAPARVTPVPPRPAPAPRGPSRPSRPGRSSAAARPGSGCRRPRPRSTAPASTVSTSQPSSSPRAVVLRRRRRPWTPRRPRRAPCRPCRARARPRRWGRGPTTGHPGVGDGLPDAGHGEDRADADHGVGRREEDDVGRGDGLQHARAPAWPARRRPAPPRARRTEARSRTQYSWKWTALRSPSIVDGHMRLDAVVGHRQQPDARLPAGAQRLGDGAERIAGAEHLRTDDVGGEVAVAEPEPLGAHAVRRQLLLDGGRSRRPGPSPAPR